MFVELGLGTVISQFASHEWSQLSIDNAGCIIGDQESLSRLTSIATIAAKWYAIGAIIITLGLSIGGYIFFSNSPKSYVVWDGPLFLLSLLTGISVLLVPIWSLLEGCNQVSSLYTFRFIQGIVTSISVWIAMLFGANLWALSISSVTALICALVFIKRRYWIFSKTVFFYRISGPKISWCKNMLPMQWRIAVSWASGFFIYSLFVPVLFRYHGPAIAGQFGMTWSVVGVLSIVSSSWLSPKIPQLAMLVARKKYDELDLLFWKVTKIIMVITVIMALAIWSFIYILNNINYPLASRFALRLLPPLPTGLLLITQVLMISSIPFSSYMRAHKQEPIMALSVLAAIMVGLSTVILGKYYSATGMAFGYLIVHIVIIPFIFLIWYRRRIEWHSCNEPI
ncbi:MAG: hypothetical protein NT010_03060 [Proteobacteria bacterium]|nr:hypothetical protein [Pseudomonadota bacterium]